MLSSPSTYYFKDDQSIDSEALFSCALLLEPDQDFAARLHDALSGQVGELLCAQTVSETLDILGSTFVELVIFDAELPELSGINMLRALKQIRPGLPLVGLVSATNPAALVSLLREGAWDCQLKEAETDLATEVRKVIQKVSLRKLQQMQQDELQVERNAFYLAAKTSQDGLAVMGTQGRAVFTNSAFDDFAAALGQIQLSGQAVNVSSLIGNHDTALARQLKLQLRSKPEQDRLWRAELAVPKSAGAVSAGAEDEQRRFQLTLTSVALGTDGPFQIDRLGDFRQNLLWVRDITQERRRQLQQRELLSATTHDLKGPLGVIRLAAEMLRSTAEPASAANLVERIYSSATKALTHLEQVLKLRKMEDGLAELEPEWQSVATLLQELENEYRDLAAARKHKLIAEVPAADLQVFADVVSLQRVMGNLVTNAIKYTPPGGEIRLSAQAADTMLRIIVADSGDGIAAEARHKLFERYGRLKQHEQIEGSGLGLYIANNIIKAHGGHIELDSQVGVGSSFAVCLPLPTE